MFFALIDGILRDRRDIPLLRLIIVLLLVQVPAAVVLFLVPSIPWWGAALYLVVTLAGFLPPFTLMLHNVSHRSVFRPRFKFLMPVIHWVVGPLFGQSPGTYAAHHIGMHHIEGNLAADLSSTLRFQRDSLWDFGRYLGRFLSVGLGELLFYFRARGRSRLFYRTLVGELSFFAAMGFLVWLNPVAGLVVIVIPWIVSRSAMMAGNWGQHAFIDTAQPDNIYRNSITCIETGYNDRCFNDGYHIGHHLEPTLHWSEMRTSFERDRPKYAAEGALVFRGVDYFAIWVLLMAKRYDVLARRVVQLGPEPVPLAEVEAMLRLRTRAAVAA